MQADFITNLDLLAVALLIDCMAGEFPPFLHPVVWMGKMISLALRLAPAAGWWRQFFFGALLTLFVVTASAGFAALVLWATRGQALLELAAGAFLLKASFALRDLGQAARRVEKPIEEGNLSEARRALRSLCSRDPTDLSEEELLAAAIESLAENASDSVIAPLFYFLFLGVPGAMGYRAINTLDAMIGYRGKFESLGKFAARLDDVANFIPARITAVLFLIAGAILRANVRQGWRILLRDGAQTPSPNGGRPMATMAGLLNVRLDKRGVYALGDAHDPLAARKARQAWRIVQVAAGLMFAGCGVVLLLLSHWGDS